MRFLPKFRFGRGRNNQTVTDLAKLTRKKLIHKLGEAGFAKACLAFDRQIEAEAFCPDLVEVGYEAYSHEAHAELPTRSVATKAVAVARLVGLAPNLQEPEQQLALVWLAGHGWGHLTLKHLLEQ